MVFNLAKRKKAISLLLLFYCEGTKYITWDIKKCT